MIKNYSCSAKEFVAQWEVRKRLKEEQREKHSRAVAKFVAAEILGFWQAIKSIHYNNNTLTGVITHPRKDQEHQAEKNALIQVLPCSDSSNTFEQRNESLSGSSNVNITVNNIEGMRNKNPAKRRSTSSNGSSTCTSNVLNTLTCVDDIDKDEDDVDDLFEFADDELEVSDDDEITIEEQEAYEAENTLIDRRLEWDTLSSDNQKSVEVLLRTNYSSYLSALNDDSLEHPNVVEDSSGVEDGGSDSDDDTSDEGDDETDEENDDDGYELDYFDVLNHHEFDLETAERVLHVPLSNKQRRLYDDYMAGPDIRKALEGDGQTLSTVLNNLRKICNHPYLVSGPDSRLAQDNVTLSMSFPRVADHQYWHPRFLQAIEYDPLKHIDLSSLNMVYFDHEFTLTAITSDRIRKCCASRKLIEELANNSTSTNSDTIVQNLNGKKSMPLGPPVPSNRLKLEIQPTNNASTNHLSSIAGGGGGGGTSSNSSALFNQQSRFSQNQQQLPQQRDQQQLVQTINGQHMFYTSTPVDKVPLTIPVSVETTSGEKSTEQKENEDQGQHQRHAFHEDSLHVIARFNERRCNGMPLFGRDLVDALTVVYSVRPVRGCRASTQNHLRQKGIGYVNCLNAMSNVTTSNLRPRKRSKIAKEDPEYRYQTSALKNLVSMVTNRAQIHSAWCDMVKLPTPILLKSFNWNTQLHRRYSRHTLPTLQKVRAVDISLEQNGVAV